MEPIILKKHVPLKHRNTTALGRRIDKLIEIEQGFIHAVFNWDENISYEEIFKQFFRKYILACGKQHKIIEASPRYFYESYRPIEKC
jgi:hypothetical protein